ncbi:hypothetical protein GUITHDRAFT_158251 [Guillardia theta CCMP2712]|uniref:J domain-containing protein n=1 Tax=Guillardia theta (strain CCMP2712) TaxID=905079 RepID=L1IZB1_GUITC|nr:hypothetical protein GUITHDRAFT_158251 [Guillardia theta CCMP2712]EKX41165.1 hypothetical protein GUITHDRAFT_158251 [Guillardia theta CCMP2712]|eukprot:XP_005828145.1 hypothetical protein GUITHDRAFT_158251 [Guillardia theta CCMP2712]
MVAGKKTLYDWLEIPQSASENDIKKAYRKLAVKHHPDKGGDEAVFKEITKAYEVLSDAQKRKIYDQYGEEGLENGGAPTHSAEDIFSMFFGGGGRRRNQGPKKGEDVVHQINVTLEDLYNGKTRKLAITRKVPVDPDAEPKVCSACDGHGVKMLTRQIGPGMIQQMQVACQDCGGQGYDVKLKTERQVLECCIEKGMKHGQKIVLRGEADQLPGTIPGDVVFVLAQEKHSTFLRKNDDLLITSQKITLIEALTGQIKCIDDEGMPMHKNPFVKGKLYIRFEIVFPSNNSISPSQKAVLEKVLPSAPTPMSLGDAEEVTMQDADEASMGGDAGGHARAATDEDGDEEMRGGQRVQCAQQ